MVVGPLLVLRVLGLVLGMQRRVVGLPLGRLLGLVLVVPLVSRLPRLPGIPRLPRVSRISQLRRALLGLEKFPGRQDRRNPEHPGRHLGFRDLGRACPDGFHAGRDDIPQHPGHFAFPEHRVFEPGEVQFRPDRQDDVNRKDQRDQVDRLARQIRPAVGTARCQRRPEIGRPQLRRPEFRRIPRKEEITGSLLPSI
jgi:hypothetical protein